MVHVLVLFHFSILFSVQNNTLEEIYEETLHIVLRSWDPTTSWVDSAQIRISVRSISIDANVRPLIDSGRDGAAADSGGGVGGGGGERGEHEYMVFRLQPVEGVNDFHTDDVSVCTVWSMLMLILMLLKIVCGFGVRS